MGKQGQPEIDDFVKFVIAYKVIQYQKRYNLTPRAAWLKLSEHKAFKDLMHEHFKNRAAHLLYNILGGPNIDLYSGNIQDAKINFYKNHIKKIIEEYPNLKIYTPKEYKEYWDEYRATEKARKIASKTQGLMSMKYKIKGPFKT